MIANRFDLSGQRILITGAATGIGAATAEVCASLGADIVLVDIADSGPVAERIAGVGRSATIYRADVSRRAEAERIAGEVGAVQALVLNAAICPWGEDWMAPDWDASFERVIAVNLLGPLHFIRAFLPGMLDRNYGRVVAVGSLAGRNGGLIAGPHYVASKGGLHAMVKWLARQVGPRGILVNGVAPASVDTPMMADQPVDLGGIPLRRKAEVEEVAWPIAFLCSAAASYISGAVIDVNGGVYMA